MSHFLTTTDSKNGVPASMQSIVDAHCHLWELELAKRGGLTQEFGSIFRTFSPLDLSLVMSQSGVSACVLIESGRTDEENKTMEEMAGTSSLIGAFTPYVDLASPTLETKLDRWRRNPKFRGVRARFEGHPDPDILTQPKILDGIARLVERELILELLVQPLHLKDILRIYEQVPQLKAAIEHMAKPDIESGSDRSEWKSCMKALASHTSAVCKLSLSPRIEQIGELLRAPRTGWPIESIKPFVGSLLQWFGSNRLMWGSDWPVALLVASYKETLEAMRAAAGILQPSDEANLFGATAMSFYGLRVS